MKLLDWLELNELSIKDFAEALGYTRSHISCVIHGHRKATADMAKAIEIATQGKITRQQMLYPEEYPD